MRRCALSALAFCGSAACALLALLGGACGSFAAADMPGPGADVVDGGADARVDAVADAGRPDGACSAATLNVDGNNCGACGHSCRGADCVSGVCTSAIVVDPHAPVAALTVDSDQLFWATGIVDAGADAGPSNHISMCPASGCVGKAMLIADQQFQPVHLHLDGAALYWLDSSRVNECPRTGCTTVTTFFEGNSYEYPADVAFDENHQVYILLDAQIEVLTKVRVCPASGCPSSGASLFATTPRCGVTNIVSDRGAIYWSSGDSQSECPGGGLFGCPVAGCVQPQTFLTGLNKSVRLAADSSGVFFALADGIQELAFPTLAPTPIIALPRVVSDLAADSGTVYWLEDGGFVRRTTSGGEPLTLASQQVKPHAIGLDAQYVYWASASPAGDGDVISRVAR